MPHQKLIEFYTVGGPDNSGRTFEDIMKFNDEELEYIHDYVQWILPTATLSRPQPNSPTLDKATIMHLRLTPLFYPKFERAVEKMLKFWQIPVLNSEIQKFTECKHAWTEFRDHNQLRMSRFMESCRLLNRSWWSHELFDALLNFAQYPDGKNITVINIAYWHQAVTGRIMFPEIPRKDPIADL